ncbi:MAG: molybdenum cofactor guanylyltransferase [Candidatus Pelagibacterales bacterium]|nr:MAG: molybdenum cofactor guanylyltransferase [Pelagibacterales bacterium]
MIENNILGIILAGGKSSRFGEDKSTAKLGNKTLLDHTVNKIENEFNEILVISNNKEFNFKNNKIHVVEDCIEGQLGPLVGILTAMKWVKKNNKNYKWIASFPCDTPFFDMKFISELKIKIKETSKKLIFLNSDKKRHNIFGLWSVDLIETLEEDIKNGLRKVEIWADKIGYENININTEEFDMFLNINTKEDLKKTKENIDKI